MHTPELPKGSEFYARLTEALRDRGMPTKQTAIANLVGVNQSTVSKWANDQAFPTKENVLTAARVTGFSFSWLYSGIGAKKDGGVDALTWALLERFEQLPPEKKKEVIDFARFKAEALATDSSAAKPAANPTPNK